MSMREAIALIKKKLNRFTGTQPSGSPQDEEALRVAFKSRYHSFKLLLNANNKALEVMSEIERALAEAAPFSMAFIRAACTTVCASVFQMARQIQNLAPGRYDELLPRLHTIRRQIEAVLAAQKTSDDERLVIPLDQVRRDMADAAGNKMANLGEMIAGLKADGGLKARIPDGFVVTAAAYQQFMAAGDLRMEINRRIQSADNDDLESLLSLSAGIQQLIMRTTLPEELAQAIVAAFQEMEARAGGPLSLAMRSSALGEDAAGSSFAGQYRSELNVHGGNILEAYKNVVAGKYSLPAITYRLKRGFRDEDITMSVGCLAMVRAACGGVAYSRNPVDPADDAVYIQAAPGLPKLVVDGSDAVDQFVVSRRLPMNIIQKEIRTKGMKFECRENEGLRRTALSDAEARNPALDDRQAVRVAELALQVEQYYNTPQDLEWALGQDGELYLLQCRPLSTVSATNPVPAHVSLQEADADILLKGGITAAPGAACGLVFLVEKASDLLRFPKGSVLVVRQALPKWAPLLGQAVALLTTQGSFAGHLASVAREFGVPAIFELPALFDILKNGDEVTVDAGARVVYRGRREAALTSPAPRHAMADSRVYQILAQVGRLITPLNLLDPASPEFTPANCRTLHDLTRYIHEKSVHEMFNFGKAHHFSERSSKQLFYKVPMQWWILNLDDGFRIEVTGKYVKLEEIASLPMLAFWEGFAAIAWDGPPPLDGKGFMSVLFQSTASNALVPTVRSKFADRNYFIISKNYCNLSSRLGYHFALLEALVSDRTLENYVSYQFKGGAADTHRRTRRVCFIGEILETYGFNVDIRQDNLIARIENRPAGYLLERMKILGYLSLHTRQLDMIMTNPARVEYYRDKIETDIRTFCANP